MKTAFFLTLVLMAASPVSAIKFSKVIKIIASALLIMSNLRKTEAEKAPPNLGKPLRDLQEGMQNLGISSNINSTNATNSTVNSDETIRFSGPHLQKTDSAVALVNAYLESQHLDVSLLNLSGNDKIGDAGAEAFAKGIYLGKYHRLRIFSMVNDNIGDAGAVALAKAFCHITIYNPRRDYSLQKVNLNNNNIGNEGANALAGILNYYSHLTLNLSNNQIGDAGTMGFANVLRSYASKINDFRITLILSNNQIGNAGATKLSEILDSLVSLDLRNNFISVEKCAILNLIWDAGDHYSDSLYLDPQLSSPGSHVNTTTCTNNLIRDIANNTNFTNIDYNNVSIENTPVGNASNRTNIGNVLEQSLVPLVLTVGALLADKEEQ